MIRLAQTLSFCHSHSCPNRNLMWMLLSKISKMLKTRFHRYETHRFLRQRTTLLRCHILTNHLVGPYESRVPTSVTWLLLFSVLHTIRTRYAQHSIYTYSGIVLIAVNPFQRVPMYGPEIIQAYSGRRKGELEPHLFAIAEDAYTRMQRDGEGQTIIVSGESYVKMTHNKTSNLKQLIS